MQNYMDSDYALNRHSGAIVYRFADGIAEVTMDGYLAENPGKTGDDFRALKKLSDDDYFVRDRADNAQTRKNIPFGELEGTMLCSAPSPLDILLIGIDAQEGAARHNQRLETARRALGRLTRVGGEQRIADLYGVGGGRATCFAACSTRVPLSNDGIGESESESGANEIIHHGVRDKFATCAIGLMSILEV